MQRILFAALSLLLFGEISLAQTKCEGAPTNYQALLSCAEVRAPEIQAAQLELEKAKSEVQAAGQRLNPELAAETLHGKNGSDNESETDISLGIPIELGGKLTARKATAEGRVAIAEAKLFEARAKVRTQFILKLHRLRQVTHEQEIVDEAIGTFSKLVTQYSKRPGLSPEQQVSLSVFQLSKSEYDLKRSATADEVLSLSSFFKLSAGLSIDQVKKVVPQSPSSWPSVESGTTNTSSPQLKLLEADLKTANAELAAARSEAWPNLTVGPSVKLLNEGDRSSQLYGLNVSLPLPVFSSNAGGKAVAAAGVRLSEARRRIGLREQELKREELLSAYQQAVKSLSTSLSHAEIERRHSSAEGLFTKGVVPSSLVIEAHRTSFELEKARHERELRALETLLELYTIDGTILEVNI